MRPLVAALLLTACAGETAPPPEEAGQVLETFTMHQVKEGQARWRLKAPLAEIQLSGAADLSEPEIFFYQNGKHASTVTAAKAVVTGDDQDMRLVGDVLIVAHAEKMKVRTERLDYDAKTERFKSETPVLITRPGGSLKGSGMEGDPSLSDITIYNQETELTNSEPGRRRY